MRNFAPNIAAARKFVQSQSFWNSPISRRMEKKIIHRFSLWSSEEAHSNQFFSRIELHIWILRGTQQEQDRFDRFNFTRYSFDSAICAQFRKICANFVNLFSRIRFWKRNIVLTNTFFGEKQIKELAKSFFLFV